MLLRVKPPTQKIASLLDQTISPARSRLSKQLSAELSVRDCMQQQRLPPSFFAYPLVCRTPRKDL
jgi:hypothetical protein